ncbi:MAG: hypothetical protein KC506_02240, partial [Nanoarchaeota archaeon]|nr:hypothetical protein [Nanoarchaeota archaeon]
MSKANELNRRKQEILNSISNYETQKKVVQSTVERITVSYNIGEIDFREYERRYNAIFKGKTPEQWINHYNIQIKSLKAQVDWC